MISFVILVLVLGGFAVLVVQQTRAKGRWGLGRFRSNCPRCGTRMPMVRKPDSFAQAMWGGWTCPQCGCRIDKYGREIASG